MMSRKHALAGLGGTFALFAAVLVPGISANAAPAALPPATSASLAAVPAAAATIGLSNKLSYWNVSSGRLNIGLTTVPSGAADQFQSVLGIPVDVYQLDAMTSMVKSDPRPATGSSATATAATVDGWKTDRTPLNDRGSVNGGDRIVSTQGNFYITCSTTTLFTDGKTPFELTAGHCGPNGSHWYQGYVDGTTLTTFADMGLLTNRHWSDNDVDAAALPVKHVKYSGSYGAQYWYTNIMKNVKDGSVPDGATVDSSASVQVGNPICTDGSVTGYKCGGTVTRTDGCGVVTEDSNHDGTIQESEKVTVCGLDTATTSGTRIVAPGDSGGPVMLPVNNGHTSITGTISGGNDAGTSIVYTDTKYLKLQTSWYLASQNVYASDQ